MKTIKDLKEFNKNFKEEELLKEMNDFIYINQIFKIAKVVFLIISVIALGLLHFFNVWNIILVGLYTSLILQSYSLFIKKSNLHVKMNELLRNNEHKKLSDEQIKNLSINENVKNEICLSWLDILISNKVKNNELGHLFFVKISDKIKVKRYSYSWSELIKFKLPWYQFFVMILKRVIQNMVFESKKQYLNEDIDSFKGGESFLFYRNIYDGYLYIVHDIKIEKFQSVQEVFQNNIRNICSNILEIDLKNSEAEDKISKQESIEKIIEEMRGLPNIIREKELMETLGDMRLEKGEVKKKKI